MTHTYELLICSYVIVCTIRAPREVRCEVGEEEGDDLTEHAHSAYSYSKNIVLQ
jgi:hypothetical protein